MIPLDRTQTQHVRAAEGWLELGNPREALIVLRELAYGSRAHPEVLELKWEIYANLGKWRKALRVSRIQIEKYPEQPSGWINQAFSLRRIQGAGLQSAWANLIPAAKRFPKNAVIRFNLACLACQMGDLNASVQWLDRAFDIDDGPEMKMLTMLEPDLSPLGLKPQAPRGA